MQKLLWTMQCQVILTKNMVIDTFEKAEQALSKCEVDFEEFYRAAMFCYGTYYYTLAMMNMEPTNIEHVKNHKRASELIIKFNLNYK